MSSSEICGCSREYFSYTGGARQVNIPSLILFKNDLFVFLYTIFGAKGWETKTRSWRASDCIILNMQCEVYT
jgi:hypothetical protein